MGDIQSEINKSSQNGENWMEFEKKNGNIVRSWKTWEPICETNFGILMAGYI